MAKEHPDDTAAAAMAAFSDPAAGQAHGGRSPGASGANDRPRENSSPNFPGPNSATQDALPAALSSSPVTLQDFGIWGVTPVNSDGDAGNGNSGGPAAAFLQAAVAATTQAPAAANQTATVSSVATPQIQVAAAGIMADALAAPDTASAATPAPMMTAAAAGAVVNGTTSGGAGSSGGTITNTGTMVVTNTETIDALTNNGIVQVQSGTLVISGDITSTYVLPTSGTEGSGIVGTPTDATVTSWTGTYSITGSPSPWELSQSMADAEFRILGVEQAFSNQTLAASGAPFDTAGFGINGNPPGGSEIQTPDSYAYPYFPFAAETLTVNFSSAVNPVINILDPGAVELGYEPDGQYVYVNGGYTFAVSESNNGAPVIPSSLAYSILSPYNAPGSMGSYSVDSDTGTFTVGYYPQGYYPESDFLVQGGQPVTGFTITASTVTGDAWWGGFSVLDPLIQVSPNATLELDGSEALNQIIALSKGSVLVLKDPSEEGGFANLGPGETIDLPTVPNATATFDQTTDSLGEGGLSIMSGGSLFADFNLYPGQNLAALTLSAVPDGNGGTDIVVGENADPPPCFAAGTRIRAARGGKTAEIPVEELHEGDRVFTRDGKTRPVTWIGHRTVAIGRHEKPEDVLPIRIEANAFGKGGPARDLFLSPDHAVFVPNGFLGSGHKSEKGGGILIPARYLVNGATVRRENVEKVTYYHVEVEGGHNVLLAEGLACETFLDTGNRHELNGNVVALRETPRRSPQEILEIWRGKGYAPLMLEGPAVEAVRERLLRIAQASGRRTVQEADLRLVANGQAIEPVSRPSPSGEGMGFYRFRLPPGAETVKIVSSSGIPAETNPAPHGDPRRLGVMIGFIEAGHETGSHQTIPLRDDAAFGAGFHRHEHNGKPGIEYRDWRWTDGRAALTVPAGASTLEICVAGVQPSWKPAAGEAAGRGEGKPGKPASARAHRQPGLQAAAA